MRFAVAFMTAALLAVPAARALAQIDCSAARCAAQAAIAQCPCDADNHGRYVSCVAHAVNQLARDGTIPPNCKGKVTRCAARSTCGKPGFVTCLIPTEFGTCDLTSTPGTCAVGTSVVGDGTCAADTDCVVSTRCTIKRAADLCTAAGGAVGTNSSCCAAPTCD